MKLLPGSIHVLLIIVVGLSLAAVAAAAPQVQTGMSPDDMRRQSEELAKRLNLRVPEKSDELDSRTTPTKTAPDSFYNRKLSDAQKKLVAPDAADLTKYRDFLRQEHTGLIRLLPRGKYEFSPTVAADRTPEAVLPIRGGGAFYSFAEKTQAFGPWSQIALDEGWLVSGFVSDSLALMTDIGDVPLDSVTPTTPGVAYLAQFQPPAKTAEATAQRTRNVQGLRAGRYTYNSVQPAVNNQTYVLRSTVYKKQGRLRVFSGGNGAVYIPHPDEYKGSDELIAFRIVRAGADGSLTILWKRLQKYEPFSLKPEEAKK